MNPKKNTLSKSTLIRSIQCSKSLYLYKNYYTLRDNAGVVQQQKFDRGHRVGKLAHQLFPGGKDCTPPDASSYNESIAATKLLMQQQHPVIYEAAFKYNGILAALDILENKEGKSYAYEVKSSFRISNTYLLDATIQYYIITKSGVELEDFSLVTINNDYVLKDSFDVHSFFKITSVMDEIRERIPFVEKSIGSAIDILDAPLIPEVAIGQHCTKPYPCDFQGYCWKHIEKDSIWYLPGVSMQEKSNFIEKGITTVHQIEINDDLNARQKVIIASYQDQQPFLQREKLRTFISNIHYPLYYFDVEAFQPAVPVFKGTKPYDRIPFLFSLHYKASETGELQHIDYISPVGEDDRINFIEHFLSATSGEGKILVFNTLMEKTILFKLSSDFPDYKNEILERIKRIIDVEIPFKELYYYHPAQQGSFSLKAIGNALLQKDEFARSQVKDGEEAMAVYNELFYEEDKNKTDLQLQQLKAYCKTDTYVLYEIFEKLKQL
ncbi:MAG: hypothetical protein JWN78_1360 [Bacteroidota bacterium]|nr:hypothetical protein [Bacteroidota bacterium]